MAEVRLASDFPPVGEKEWLRRVAATLKGRSFESLSSHTLDGIEIKPLYQGPAVAPAPLLPDRSAGKPPWTVVQRADIPDLAQANAQLLDDLENGAGGIALVLPRSVAAAGHGLPISDLGQLKRLMEGVELDLISVRLDAGPDGRRAAELLLDLYGARNLDLSGCDLTPGLDPLGSFALTGSLVEEPVLVEGMGGTARRLNDAGHRGAAFLADTRIYHGAGASETQELAFALATGVAYLRWLWQAGVAMEDAAWRIGFLLTADADQFLTVAKFRAARLLWRRVEEAMELEPQPLALHAETAWRMMTKYDPHVNLLRTATAAFAAGVGGADSVTVLPFTIALGLPDAFARRLARNIQSILIEESGIGRVEDATAGSGYVEGLTAELAGKAWKLFQSIEAQGGMLLALQSGFVQGLIADVSDRRRAATARREIPLTGITEFPLLDPSPLAGEGGLRSRPDEGDAAGDFPLTCPPDGGLSSPARGEGPVGCTPLQVQRLAAPFEALRETVDAHLARTGKRPLVFLATLGSPAEFSPRAGWVENLLAAGGVAAVAGGDMAREFRQSGATVVCICSSDDLYARQAAEAAHVLKQAGAGHILLAGRPGSLGAELRAAGVEDFLFAGQDVLLQLEKLHRLLGVARA